MTSVGGIAGDQLKSFIERVERLHEERKALADDISEVFSEAKGRGFDVKIMKEIIKIRKIDKDDLDEHDAMLQVYMRAIGMLPEADGTPVALARVPARAAE